MKYLKSISITIGICLIVLLITLFAANYFIKSSATDLTFDKIENIPDNQVGLLLGTSKTLSNGYSNYYFKYRIDATVDLFKNNKIKYLIISGDNSSKEYDEPTDMKNELIKNGIDSTKIYLDYAGFRTFDSVVRAKEIFGQNNLLIISQKFHNERAIYITHKLKMKAIGFNAKDVSKYFGIKTVIREYFARVKVIIDFIIGVDPKFLGEKVQIGNK
ncbi:MAG: hypothetical protein RLZZ175_643 [Bacteroidota bacterium]|jgi:SanA protein